MAVSWMIINSEKRNEKEVIYVDVELVLNTMEKLIKLWEEILTKK